MIDFARSDPARCGADQTTSPHPGLSAPKEVLTRRRELARLGDDIARLSAHIQAATYRLLEMIRAFDESQGWLEEGFQSCATWLSWRTRIGPGAAREKVRVARALAELPELSAALRGGELSYSVARAITRVANPGNEADLVEVARHATAAEMERLVGASRVANRSEEQEKERHEDRGLWVVPEADGSWRIRGRLDPEVGALLCRALEAAGEALRGGGGTNAETPAEARRADAIGLLAEAALGNGLAAADATAVTNRAERFQVVVHVSAETLTGANVNGVVDPGSANSTLRTANPAETPWIEGGPHVSAETSRRLACDSGVVEMTHERDGSVLNVGRRRRTVPTPLRRALDHRDSGCRFPGCRARFCDAHHVRPWAEGGATALDNLLLLCRRHHRLVHEDGWQVRMDARGEVRFHRPDGRLLTRVPEPPAVPTDPVAELERRHPVLKVDPWNPTSRWPGERLNVDWTLSVLCQVRGP